MEIEQVLTEREQDALNSFVGNQTMLEAVKKVVLSSIYFDGTITKEGIPNSLTNFMLAKVSVAETQGLSNEQLGADMKASLAGVQLIEKGFAKLERFNKRKKPENKGSNPAR